VWAERRIAEERAVQLLLGSWPAGSSQTVATEARQLVDTCQGARIENNRRVIVQYIDAVAETDEIISGEAKQMGGLLNSRCGCSVITLITLMI
jgi:hypothetical protein